MALQKRHLGLTSCTIEILQLLLTVGTGPKDAINLYKHLGHVSGPCRMTHIKGGMSSQGSVDTAFRAIHQRTFPPGSSTDLNSHSQGLKAHDTH